MRRATHCNKIFLEWIFDFYPRSPCGERLAYCINDVRCIVISIHALLAESDVDMSSAYPAVQCISIHALLAESDGNIGSAGTVPPTISIHALLAESDAKADRIRALFGYFYPRSPCGERPPFLRSDPMMRPYFYPRSPCGERPPRLSRVVPTPIFLSTLSLRRATLDALDTEQQTRAISIHALLAESDVAFPAQTRAS